MPEDEQQSLLNNKPKSTRQTIYRFRASKAFTQITVATSIFTDDVLYGIIVPVLPNFLRDRFGLAEPEIQRWISVLLGVFGATGFVTALVAGWITDRSKSRQSTFLAGLLALTGATVLLYIGNSIPLLVVARALQGMATAIVHTVGIAMVVDKCPPDQLGWALGIVGASMTAAVLLGPLLGGVIYKYAGYQAVFGLSFGLLGLDIILRLLMIEKPVDDMKHPETGQIGYGTASPRSNVESALVSTRHTESEDLHADGHRNNVHGVHVGSDTGDRSSSKWVPLGVYLLASPRVLVCLFSCLMNASMLTCFDSTLPIFVRETFGWNPAKQGLVFLTIAIPSLFAPLTGHLSDKYGTRTPITLGFILAAPAFACLGFVKDSSTEHEVLLCLLLVVIGICLTLIHPATMAEVNHAVRAEMAAHPSRFKDQEPTGQANAIRNCAFSGGITVGPLFAGFVKAQFGWSVMVCIMGLLALLAAPLTLLWAGGWLTIQKPRFSNPFAQIGFTSEESRSLARDAGRFWRINAQTPA